MKKLDDRPRRVRLSRKRGWRMPPNTVKVSRPTKWGNPWSIKGTREWLASVGVRETFTDDERRENCVYQYRLWMVNGLPVTYERQRQELLSALGELRGKNLACWCRLDQPCHADTLLELANEPPLRQPDSPQREAIKVLVAAIEDGRVPIALASKSD